MTCAARMNASLLKAIVLLSSAKYFPSGPNSIVLKWNSPKACAPPMPPVTPIGIAKPVTFAFVSFAPVTHTSAHVRGGSTFASLSRCLR
jgi:hypothetical protein